MYSRSYIFWIGSFLILCIAFIDCSSSEDVGSNGSTNNTRSTLATDVNNSNGTAMGNYVPKYLVDKGTLKRVFYIFIGLTAIVCLYFAVRFFRSQRRRSRTKRYGVLSKGSDSLEMTPLDQDEDDDDVTVYDVNRR